MLMREIMFRGKVLEDGYNFRAGEFVYGSLVFEGDEPYIVGPVVEANEDYIAHEWWVPVDPATVGQYIGLKDKNGREIYEGDIVTGLFNHTDIIGHIIYGSSATFFIKRKGLYGIGLNNAEDWLEVVGNIYENPELLKT